MQTFKISEAISSEDFKFPKVIGLTGAKGVGKSTLAEKIGGQIHSLATPIKEMLSVIIPPEYLHEKKEDQIPGMAKGFTARRAMQTLGTEFGRAQDPDIWVRIVENKITDQIAWATATRYDFFRCIVDDIRFQNEVEMIHRLEGEVWRVTREGHIVSDSHVSEQGISEDSIDKEILV